MKVCWDFPNYQTKYLKLQAANFFYTHTGLRAEKNVSAETLHKRALVARYLGSYQVGSRKWSTFQ
jgi:hypothetical protein